MKKIMDKNYPYKGIYLIINGQKRHIKTLNEVFETYNRNELSQKYKVLLESIMVFGFTTKAYDFIMGFLNKKDGDDKFGKNIFKQAQKLNQQYLAKERQEFLAKENQEKKEEN